MHDLLAPQNGEHIWILAAPGGKTTHILEVAPEAQVVAVDIDEQRLSRILRQFKTPWYEATVNKVMAVTLPNGVASNSLIAFY